MDFVESTINYIGSKEWAIDAEWGLSQFAEFLFNSQNGLNAETLKALKEQSNSVNYFADLSPATIDYSGDNKIAELSFSGTMHLQDGLCHYGAKSLVSQLYQAYADPTIKGILLSVDSGGGDPQAGSEIDSAVRDRNKPVVSRFNMAASAMLMAIQNSDEIIAANQYAKIGSIGAFVSVNTKFLKQYADQILDIYSTHSGDKNIELRELLNGNSTPMLRSVDDLAATFQKDISKSRKISDKFSNTLNGGVWRAAEGKRRGLVDSIGSKQYALKRVISYTK